MCHFALNAGDAAFDEFVDYIESSYIHVIYNHTYVYIIMQCIDCWTISSLV